MPFAHIHVHSDYSLLDGASRLPFMVSRAKKLGQTAIALTDHGVMHGAIKLIVECEKNNIKPIIGNEMYTIPADITQKYKGKKNHLIVLARTTQGYKNLCKLTSISHLQGWQGSRKGSFGRPCINRELLAQHKEGLIIASGCLGGELPQLIMKNRLEEALECARWFKETFGDNYYIEIQDHARRGNVGEIQGDNKESIERPVSEAVINRSLVDIAKKLNIKVIATNDSHFVLKEDFPAHNTLVTINASKKFADGYTGTEFIKSEAEMRELFNDHLTTEEINEAINNTQILADSVEEYDLFDKNRIPQYKIPEQYAHLTPLQYLTGMANFGLKQRLDGEIPEDYKDRLKYELQIIAGQGFEDYFLVVQDYCNWAHKNDIPVGAGRGSAGGSLLAWALRITNINPMHHGLMFERFLNPERKSMPDIDTDFCIERRVEVIDYCASVYGRDHVVQIGTFGELAPRQALKDVGRVNGISYAILNEITKTIPVYRGVVTSLNKLLEDPTISPEFNKHYDSNSTIKSTIDMAAKLEGTNKSFGLHAAGVIIATEPVDEIVPLAIAKATEDDADPDKVTVVSQYDMNDIEKLGFLKMDFLGLKNLTIIYKTLQLINNLYINEKYILARDNCFQKLETEDVKKAYDLAASGDLNGVFQIESPGMTQLVKEMKPRSIDELSLILALYRPGIKDANLLDSFVSRFKGEEPVSYLHPLLEPILKSTFGIPVYQEQIMKMAQDLAGYTLGQADLLRRAMGKKKPEVMAKEEPKFISGCIQNGVAEKTAKEIFAVMETFASYCFNYSHSAAYAYITWETLWLKANYPLEYISCLISGVADDHEKVEKYYISTTEQGIKFLPPDVNHSFSDFIPENDTIRFALRTIKSVSRDAADSIVIERKREGEYISFSDFCRRNNSLNKGCIHSLVYAGAFDSMGITRRQLINETESLLKSGKNEVKWQEHGQLSLFLLPEFQAAIKYRANPDVDEFILEEKSNKETEVLGICLGDSPLKKWQQLLKPFASKISSFELGETYSCLAVISTVKIFYTKNGDPMCALTINDGRKVLDAIVFPSIYANFCNIINSSHQKARFLIGEYQLNKKNDTKQFVINYVSNPDTMKIAAVYCETHEVTRVKSIMSLNRGYIPTVIKTPQGRLGMKINNWIRNIDCLKRESIKAELLDAYNLINI